MESMETIESHLNVICRTCLKFDNSIKIDVYHLMSALKVCALIEISKDDGLPSGLCNECYKKLTEALKFRKLCEKSNSLLKTHGLSVILTQNSINESEIIKESTSENETRPLSSNSVDNIEENDNIVSESFNENTNDTCSDSANDDRKNKRNLNNCEVNKFSCKFCQIVCITPNKLKAHEAEHENKHVCDECGKELGSRRKLYTHKHFHKRQNAQNLCPICGKSFTLSENLIRHIRLHTGKLPYKCPHCPNRSFNQRNELQSHLVTHSKEKQFLCNICGNAYARSKYLVVHMRRVHPDPNVEKKEYKCSVCNKIFDDPRCLKRHNTSIHSAPRRYVCKFCGKAFNHKDNVRVHERIHTGHRPHSCPQCPLTFIQKHVLQTHMKKHGVTIIESK